MDFKKIVITFIGALMGGPLLTFNPPAWAEENDLEKNELSLSKENYKKIFEDSYSDSLEKETVSQRKNFKGQVQFGKINELILESRYFTVPYSDVVKSILSMEATLEKKLFSKNRYQLNGAASVGYSYLEKKLTVYPSTGGQLVDLARLHWLPLSVGPVVSYALPVASSIATFSAGIKGGWQWLNQTGSLDGMNQNFLVPFYNLEGAVCFGLGRMNLLTHEHDQSINLSVQKINSLENKQKIDLFKLGAGLVIKI